MVKRTQKPTDDQFEIAIMWLQANSGDGGEADACMAVANWIERYRAADLLRSVAREGGVSVSKLRERLAGKASADPEMEN